MLCSECRAHGNSVNFDSAGRQKEHFYGMKLESYVFPECIFPLGQSVSNNKPGSSSVIAPNGSALLINRTNLKVRIPFIVGASIGMDDPLYRKRRGRESYRKMKSRTSYIHSPLVRFQGQSIKMDPLHYDCRIPKMNF